MLKSKYSIYFLLLGIALNKCYGGYSSGYPQEEEYGRGPGPKPPGPPLRPWMGARPRNAIIELEDESSLEDVATSSEEEQTQNRNPFPRGQFPRGKFPPGISPFMGKNPFPPQGQNPFPTQGQNPFPPPGQTPFPPRGQTPPQGQNPFSKGQNPFPKVQNPFSRGQNPSEQGQNPFSQGRIPFPQGQNPFSQGQSPSDQVPDPAKLGQNPFPQGQNPFQQGRNPTEQGQNPFPQGRIPFPQGQNPFSQGQSPEDQVPDPAKLGQNPFPQGQNPFQQGRNPFPPGQNQLPQGQNTFPQGQNPFPQGQNPFPVSQNRLDEGQEEEPESSVENRRSQPPALRNKIVFFENIGNKDCGLIQVDVFFDGLCKKSRDFIVNHLFPAWKEFSDIIWINLVPFSGKNRAEPENRELDTQLAVIINIVPDMKKKMHLIRCLMDYSKKGRDQMQVLTYCSKICHQTEILSKIVDAINKPDALELIEHAKILAVEREIENIPAVLIDGNKKDTPNCLKHFKQAIIERAGEKGLEDMIQITNMNQMIDSPLSL